jgi:hypothetical protein
MRIILAWLTVLFLGLSFIAFGMWTESEGRTVDTKTVNIIQVDNGYVVELRQTRNPYPFKTQIAPNAQGAAALAYAYLSGPLIRGTSK